MDALIREGKDRDDVGRLQDHRPWFTPGPVPDSVNMLELYTDVFCILVITHINLKTVS